MSKPLPINCDFIEFLANRSAPFLVRYGSLAEPEQWRHRILEQQLPDWRMREQNADPDLTAELTHFIALTFGAGRLPMLRRRYSTHLHRMRRLKKAIDLDLDAYAALERIQQTYQLDSYSEAILWMAREIESTNFDD